jgi:ElaB/YqjD/DUF883 family membrane-anchored ribosome-binding protein
MNPKDSPISSINEGASTLSSALNEVKSTVGSASQDLKQIAANESARIGQQLLEWLQRNAQTARDAAGSLREEAVAVGDRTQRYVRDEPMKSVAIAAAAGAGLAMLCMLLGRRSGDR